MGFLSFFFLKKIFLEGVSKFVCVCFFFWGGVCFFFLCFLRFLLGFSKFGDCFMFDDGGGIWLRQIQAAGFDIYQEVFVFFVGFKGRGVTWRFLPKVFQLQKPQNLKTLKKC